MIQELSNNTLFMYEGDTGTVGFSLSGDCESGDQYIFAVKKTLNDEPLISQTFTGTEFTVVINESSSKLLTAGNYLWGLKLHRVIDSENEIDTIVGTGTLRVKKGV